MKILVTGASGFIGRHVCRYLLTKSGVYIIAQSRSGKNLVDLGRQGEWITYDISRREHLADLYAFFQRPDILVHLAWQGLPHFESRSHIDEHLPVQKLFLESLISGGLKSLTVTGTCLEYGLAEGELFEEDPAQPSTEYAEAKNELRLFLESLQKRYHFSMKWIRLFYMYGSGQYPKSLLAQLDKAIDEGKAEFDMSAGEQRRDYLPVEDVAQNIAEIAIQKEVEGIINCCSGRPVSVRQLVEKRLVDRKAGLKLNLGVYPYPSYEALRFWGNTKKMESALSAAHHL